MTTLPDLFAPAVLTAWTRLAANDAFVARCAILADVRLGLRNTDNDQALWLAVTEPRQTPAPLSETRSVLSVQGGPGLDHVAFYLEGPQDAFDDLVRGLSFNRLVRQHRLTVAGDLRCCVQNWLLLYALMRLTAQLEG